MSQHSHPLARAQSDFTKHSLASLGKVAAYFFTQCGVLVDLLYLITADVVNRVAVLGRVKVTTAIVLGHTVIIATVVLGCHWVTLKHGVELGGTLQCGHTVSSPGRPRR